MPQDTSDKKSLGYRIDETIHRFVMWATKDDTVLFVVWSAFAAVCVVHRACYGFWPWQS